MWQAHKSGCRHRPQHGDLLGENEFASRQEIIDFLNDDFDGDEGRFEVDFAPCMKDVK